MIRTDQPTIFPDNVMSAVSSIDDGSMKFEWGERQDIITNSRVFLDQSGIRLEETVNLFISGTSGWEVIRSVGTENRGEGMQDPESRIQADVLVTKEPNVALFLPTADCYPVIMYDRVKKVIALAHLGWQSTEKRVAAKTIDYLMTQYGSVPENILVFVGPGIKKESYRFEQPQQLTDPEWKPYLTQLEDGRWGIDLLGFNLNLLKSEGILDQHIEVSDVDTAKSRDYYSHYGSNNMDKPGPHGRFATVAMIRG